MEKKNIRIGKQRFTNFNKGFKKKLDQAVDYIKQNFLDQNDAIYDLN